MLLLSQTWLLNQAHEEGHAVRGRKAVTKTARKHNISTYSTFSSTHYFIEYLENLHHEPWSHLLTCPLRSTPSPLGCPPPEKRKKKKEEKKEVEERKRKERRVSVVHIFTGAWRMVKLAFASPLEKSESFPLTPSFPIPRQKPSIVESFIP